MIVRRLVSAIPTQFSGLGVCNLEGQDSQWVEIDAKILKNKRKKRKDILRSFK